MNEINMYNHIIQMVGKNCYMPLEHKEQKNILALKYTSHTRDNTYLRRHHLSNTTDNHVLNYR